MGLGFLLPRRSAAFTLPETDTLSFSVFRKNDSPMGYHRLRFLRDGDRLIMEKEINLEVSLAFVTAYSYRHHNREVWQGGRLVEIETRTNDDGDDYWLRAKAGPDGLMVDGSGGSYVAPADIIPTSYWNSAITSATQLLDTQRGLIMDVRMEDKGAVMLETEAGTLRTRQHTINILTNPPGRTNQIDLWYDDTSQWVGLAFEAKGQKITYVMDSRAIPPEPAPQSAARL
ncbi:hypothetical protein CHU95_09595 [Niveispirillum lacus]|uniref:DUF3108 domain-containing protein n=2 Tax=Niveispirillum lacus TaxID=1981099 RepID=A0A255Z041_9PROT|nr:hypothetical protein CHU95_09595 [Niveispirillum lacus]